MTTAPVAADGSGQRVMDASTMSTAHAERPLDAGDGAITVEKDGGVLLIGIDRPAKRNALTPGL
ncbi:hypothetical protein [Rhodococcus koreensis]|uniref:hypothetical protein n=1 Tax=Rhodococcus koreensis TaxID=99653 RepID=UPI001980F2A9|nr:hypothetical protein [Rhodococcus koreensis]QSE86384.1 hypothetical protein JWS14_46170 [Rhodococcus koreensis]